MKILGLSTSVDAAAALVDGGRVVAASAQERFDRVKHSRAFPVDALRFCLERGGVSLAELDGVAFFWNPGRHLDVGHPRLSTGFRHQLEFLVQAPERLFSLPGSGLDASGLGWTRQTFGSGGRARERTELEITYVTHHLCHSATAFFPSPFERAAILTLDGYGERAAGTIGRGGPDGIEILEEIPYPTSLGSFYAAVTEYLGFRPNSGEGKVMGLAPWGAPDLVDDFREILRVDEDARFELDLSWFAFHLEPGRRFSDRFVRRFGPPREPEAALEDRHRAVAASAQAVLEEAVVALARRARRLTGETRLGMAGGVALNSAANGAVVREAGFDEHFFFPAAGDSGSAVGAALWVAHEILGGAERTPWTDDRLGPEWSDEEIGAVLAASSSPAVRVDDPATAAADRIAAGAVVGWFQGRAELGPRALGGRSILADPRSAAMRDRVNERVKRREAFRPFAPSVTAEAADRYFEMRHPDPYMLTVCPVRPEHREHLAAVTHVDGTARIQVVTRERDPLYHRLLVALEERIGVPVVLDTSFNLRGEPIVGTPAEALATFWTSGLDALLLGAHLLEKRS